MKRDEILTSTWLGTIPTVALLSCHIHMFRNLDSARWDRVPDFLVP